LLDRRAHRALLRDVDHNSLPIEIAKQITNFPQEYPRPLVTLASEKYREVVTAKIIPVGEIAQKDEWFAQG